MQSYLRLYYSKYNPIYQLYVTRSEKGLAVHRVADSSQICDIFVKDFKVVVAYDWDTITGKYISIFFNDGVIRLYDVFKAGRLISFMRGSVRSVDAATWDRVIEKVSEDRDIESFDFDLTKSMPSLIKFVKDARSIYMIPYFPGNHTWREMEPHFNSANVNNPIIVPSVLDAHISHSALGDKYSLLLNGVYDVSDIFVPDPCDADLHQIMKVRSGIYNCFYKNGSMRLLDLTLLSNNDLFLGLLQNIIEIRNLSRYLADHIDFIKRELITPYTEFTKLTCVDAFQGFDVLYRMMNNLLLAGDLNEEFGDWLFNTIGEKNYKKWKKLGLDMFEKIVQILSLAFIPACERFVIIVERIISLLNAISYLQKKDEFIEKEELTALIKSITAILKGTLTEIPILNNERRNFDYFIEWIKEIISDINDEDYKGRFSLESSSLIANDIHQFLEIQFKHSGTKFENIIISFENEIILINSLIGELDKRYVKPIISEIVSITEIKGSIISNNIIDSAINEIIHLSYLKEKGNFLYIVKMVNRNNSTDVLYRIGLSETENFSNLYPECIISIPKRYNSLDLIGCRIITYDESNNEKQIYDGNNLLSCHLKLNKHDSSTDLNLLNINNPIIISAILKYEAYFEFKATKTEMNTTSTNIIIAEGVIKIDENIKTISANIQTC